ncbi:hypothetical protein [Halalkalicoccus jeotgali]|uniref:Uncharacterized protein n=1 Tax=Halalkalicoccus jeotgali (strain DSM 18796 / CECT 7217 / JCM 14584 / KCTC 4019 / B3) TaxID=795797 RepID=D8J3A9_HALJB|nr:hypothetical protein [Halalkalicoccus jeotgali]ADJ15216.1 hypothetical protein HacjB3_09165 [Halalkalicoccus jeotgali B3]ELY35207.1 hypothetical protein C497_13513 [Halalkalicoccus jeotgali B3]
MGEKKTTLFEINVENFEFSPSPRFGDELAKAVEGIDGKGSKLGLFGSKGVSEDDEDGEGIDEDQETSSGLFSRTSTESEEADGEPAPETEETEVEVEDPDAVEDESGGGLGLLIGLLFLLVVAAVAKKFVAPEDGEAYEEVELSEYEN